MKKTGTINAGVLGQDATEFLQELGRRIAAATGDPRSCEVLFQRGNAACVLGTCTDSCTDDFFIV